jgi:uncharacterized membrane protein
MSEPDTGHAAGPVTPQTPVVSNYGLVLTVYILYLVGFLTGITVLVGLVIAYLQRDRTDRVSQSHFQYQITTFWIGLLYFFLGFLTLHILIGALILLWWVVWTVIRCVKGLLALNMGEPMRNPNSWWFGDDCVQTRLGHEESLIFWSRAGLHFVVSETIPLLSFS